MELEEAKGAYISEVIEDGPSENAGLRGTNRQINSNGRQIEIGGDVIVALDGEPVNNFTDLLSYITLYSSPGQDITATIIRNGQYLEIVITVEARPTSESIFPFP
jgi:S1-C subfamily serine protease